jgi:hypothetical protein
MNRYSSGTLLVMVVMMSATVFPSANAMTEEVVMPPGLDRNTLRDDQHEAVVRVHLRVQADISVKSQAALF